jgi:hypothetical protein
MSLAPNGAERRIADGCASLRIKIGLKRRMHSIYQRREPDREAQLDQLLAREACSQFRIEIVAHPIFQRQHFCVAQYLPNPIAAPDNYVPLNGPAIGDLRRLFDFRHKRPMPR